VGGIDRLGAHSSGTITGFGSVIVNGVEWEVSGTTDITIDDAPGTESGLAVGQVVLITGELDNSGTSGTATSIEYDSVLEGNVTSINLAGDSFVVLGQTVSVSSSTVFDDSLPDRSGPGGTPDGRRTLADLLVGDNLEISGFPTSAGVIQATRIDDRGGASGAEVRGVVSALNTVAETFLIGTLNVDYSNATLEDFSSALANGNLVEVEGSLSGGTLVATRVELEDNLPGDDGDSGEVEGLVTRFVSATDFDVNGVRVTTVAGTQYEGGTAGNLGLNVKVEVEGEFNAQGILVADEVKFRVQEGSADVEIEGNVAARTSTTLTIEGMDAITISVNAATQLEDDRSSPQPGFNFSHVVVGDFVEIRGAPNTATGDPNDVIATRLERDDDEDDTILQGPVQSFAGPVVLVLGVAIATDAIDVAFFDVNDDEISSATFFSSIGVGSIIKAKADELRVFGNDFDAEEIEIE